MRANTNLPAAMIAEHMASGIARGLKGEELRRL
jgi:hypothetical protein